MKMTMIGTGYLGATHAACMAELGHEVLGLDVDEHKITQLAAGTTPFYEPGLDELLAKHTQSGRLRFTTDPAEAAEFANIHFIGVGTPQQAGSFAADLNYLHAAVDSIAEHLRGEHLLIGKSTVPVGTAADLQQRYPHLEVMWNPEFLREGHAVNDTLHPDRIVMGVRDGSTAAETLTQVYAQPIAEGTPVIVTDLATAELVKTSANAFLATKISFINAVSEICEVAGADIVDLAHALGLDDRIGPKFLGAGLGFGGGCLPKDIRAFMARAGELGANEALTFLREVDAINLRRREHLVQMAREACGGNLIGVRVTVLGAAFKPNSDDVRDSPALAVAGALNLAGAHVTVTDPKALAGAQRVFPTLAYEADTLTALRGADLVVLATEWDEYTNLDPQEVKKIVRRPVVIDGRNALDRQAWRDAGFDIHAMGRA
ncbi:UDP-glucose dehydrogenase family protein [Corynebacterium aquilae]|uniref:UDP-glucose 6-dehydrogenase n=1 Tax=Corynebacterium aquilae DSM 44791 TaxID=1431546 RepID=A0A1L7CID3_9CORY|nr:UDP-glucose/GDP-mannose dehydrogenase family protein [Corynebacterium aquilae]APT85569.1 UDP-glucose 6-dehydrogenase [Corynebacterium aquilae DSM 44791]